MLLNCGVGEDSWESFGLQGDRSWVFIGRTDVQAETPVLWPPEAKIWLIWEDPDAGKDWGQEEKGTTEDEMVGWHHQLDGFGLGGLRELVMEREAWHVAVHGVTNGHDWVTELNWSSHYTTGLTVKICVLIVPHFRFQSFLSEEPSALTFMLKFFLSSMWCNGKKSACQCRRRKRHGLIIGLRRPPGGGNGNPLQNSCLGNLTDHGAWQATVYGVPKSWTLLRTHTHKMIIWRKS